MAKRDFAARKRHGLRSFRSALPSAQILGNRLFGDDDAASSQPDTRMPQQAAGAEPVDDSRRDAHPYCGRLHGKHGLFSSTQKPLALGPTAVFWAGFSLLPR